MIFRPRVRIALNLCGLDWHFDCGSGYQKNHLCLQGHGTWTYPERHYEPFQKTMVISDFDRLCITQICFHLGWQCSLITQRMADRWLLLYSTWVLEVHRLYPSFPLRGAPSGRCWRDSWIYNLEAHRKEYVQYGTRLFVPCAIYTDLQRWRHPVH